MGKEAGFEAGSIADEVARALEKLPFAEAMLHESRYFSAGVKDREVDSARKGFTRSIAFRVHRNSFFGFATSNTFDGWKQLLSEAGKLAASGRGKTSIGEPQANNASAEIKPAVEPDDLGEDEKMGLLKEYSSSALEAGAFSVASSYTDWHNKTVFLNSLGARLEETEVRVHAAITAFARGNGKVESSFDQVKCRGGMEALEGFGAKAEKTAREAAMLLKAKAAPSGRMTVVLDPELAGVLAHEAVGHACEADGVQIGDSALAGMLGKKIGNECVNISDSPVRNRSLWGSYAFDDEGTIPRGTRLVEGGMLSSYITSLENSRVMRGKLTGNARTDFSGMQIVRMSNTFFEEGDAGFGELFEGVNGAYLVGVKEGQVSPKTGNFTFAAKYGYVVKKGKKGQLVKNCSINGSILSSLHGIDLVGKDLSFSPGTCGKDGQEAPVTTGSPHLRIRKIIVG